MSVREVIFRLDLQSSGICAFRLLCLEILPVERFRDPQEPLQLHRCR